MTRVDRSASRSHLRSLSAHSPDRRPDVANASPSPQAVDSFQAGPARGAQIVPAPSADPAALQQLVTGAYQTVLRRSPDAAGLANWVGAAGELAKNGANPAQVQDWVESQMKTSTEFQALQLTDQAFQDLLGRDVSGGRGTWHDQAVELATTQNVPLDEVRAFLQQGISASDEYQFAHVPEMIGSLYQTLLERDPDPDGLQHYTDLAAELQQSGASAPDVEAAITQEILQSTEYLASHPQPPDPSEGTVAGADTSNNQSDALFARSLQGTQWSAIKATQGTGFDDPTFPDRWNQLGQKIQDGQLTLRVAYQFMEAGDGTAQAKHLLARVGVDGPLPPGTRLALDWENSPQSPHTLNDPQALRDAAHYITQVTGTPPIIYTSASNVEQVKSLVPGAPIWDANWSGGAQPGDTFVQSDDGQTKYGAPAGEPWDHDLFNGNLAALRAFAGF